MDFGAWAGDRRSPAQAPKDPFSSLPAAPWAAGREEAISLPYLHGSKTKMNKAVVSILRAMDSTKQAGGTIPLPEDFKGRAVMIIFFVGCGAIPLTA